MTHALTTSATGRTRMLAKVLCALLGIASSAISSPTIQQLTSTHEFDTPHLHKVSHAKSVAKALVSRLHDDTSDENTPPARRLRAEDWWTRSIGDFQVQISLPTHFEEGWSNRGLTRFVYRLQKDYVNVRSRDWSPKEWATQEWPYSHFYFQTREKYISIRPVQRSARPKHTESMTIAQMVTFTELLEHYVEGRTEGNDEKLNIRIVGSYDRNHVLATGDLGSRWWGANRTISGVDDGGNITEVSASKA